MTVGNVKTGKRRRGYGMEYRGDELFKSAGPEKTPGR